MLKLTLLEFIKGKIKKLERNIERKSPTDGVENQLLVKQDSKSNKWVYFDELEVDLKTLRGEFNTLLIAEMFGGSSYKDYIIGKLENPNTSIDIYINGKKVDESFYGVNQETGFIQFLENVDEKYGDKNDDFIMEIYNTNHHNSGFILSDEPYSLVGRIRGVKYMCINCVNSDKTRYFAKASNVRYIDDVVFGPDVNPNTSYIAAFYNAYLVEEIKSIKTIVPPVDVTEMFSWCRDLKKIPIFDTSKVVNMTKMFATSGNLQTIPLLDTNNVETMESMFNGCNSLLTIPALNTSNVKSMKEMFYGCGNLQTIPLLDTSNVTVMSDMFYECNNLQTIPLLDTSNVTDMSSMFYKCSNLEVVPILNTGNVTSMIYMFMSCNTLKRIEKLDVSKVSDCSRMFQNCDSLSYIKLVSTSLDNLQQVINKLPTHEGAETDAYIIDLTECTIDVTAITAPAGWTIKLPTQEVSK